MFSRRSGGAALLFGLTLVALSGCLSTGPDGSKLTNANYGPAAGVARGQSPAPAMPTSGMPMSGNMQPGTMQPAMMPGGSMPGNSMPGNMVMMPNGNVVMMPNGSMPNGSMPNGSMPNGAMPGGTMPNGGMPNGAMPAGMSPDYQRVVYYQDLPAERGKEMVLKDSRVNMPAHPGVPGMPGNPIPAPGPMPTELNPTSHPPYTIAPPDIITIDALRLIPKPPYRVEPLEILVVNVTDTLPNQPIAGTFVVSPEGSINLGFNYGSVRVVGMTLEQIQNTVRTHLGSILRNAQVTVALAQFRGLQELRGQHLVRQDGTITLGGYGSVYVAGMTLGQAKCMIEKHLSEYLLNPQVSLDVFAYNSKVYYLIFDGAGFGQQVIRLPVTGNETVLDAIAMVQGIAPVSSKKRMWLARPSPVHHGCNQIMPIDWNAITQAGSTATNYQIFPGDRIYVDSDCLIKFDNYLAKLLAPVERILGTSLLGVNVAQGFQSLRLGLGTGTTAVVVP